MVDPESNPPARPLASRRSRVLVGLAAILLALRAALPLVLAPILAERADQALEGHIAFDDLDLALLRGGITFHGLSIYTEEAPASAPPLFEADRLATEISWLALASRTLEIEAFEVEDFVLRLDRFAEGIRLPRLAAASDPAADPDEEASALDWSVAADGVSLVGGRLEIVDHTVEGEAQLVAFEIEDLSARELAVRSVHADDEPGRISIDAKLDEGSVSLATWIKRYEAGFDVRTTIVLDDLPIDDLRAYLTPLGWSALAGKLDATLEHHSTPDGRHTLSGRAALAGFRVGVPRFEEPALAFEELVVVIDELDLGKRHVAIESLALDGPRILVDPRADPVVVASAPPAKESEPAGDPAATESEPETAAKDAPISEPAPARPAWTWRIARATIANGVVDLRGGPEPVVLALDGEAEGLSSAADASAPLALRIGANPGSLGLQGELSTAPLRFAGRLAIEALPLRPLLAQVEGPGLHWLHTGVLRSDLSIVMAEDLRAAGALGLRGIELGDASDASKKKRFSVVWRDLDLAIRSLVVPIGGERSETPARETAELRLARLTLSEPSFVLTRGEDGLVLPPLTPQPIGGEESKTASAGDEQAASADAGSGDGADAEAGTKSAVASADTSGEHAAGGGLSLVIDELRIVDGHGKLYDRVIEPNYRGRIEKLDLLARGVRWPERAADSIELEVEGLRGAKLALRGSVHPDETKLTGELAELPLAQFTPYLTETGYEVRDGALSLESKAKFGSERFRTKNRIVLSALDVGGESGEAEFEKSFGLSLPTAIGLLEDLGGKISLAVPVRGRPEKVKIGLGTLVGQAIRKALLGALAAPLKLLGASSRGEKIESLSPPPIPFVAGESEPTPGAEARARDLAALLERSPGVVLRLVGQTSSEDDRLLCERALHEQLEAGRGLRALAALGEIGTRRAVREHLARKLSGRMPGPLAPADARWLESQIDAAGAPTESLEALATRRAESLRALLLEAHEVRAEQLELAAPRIDPPADEGGVAIELGAMRRANATP